MSSRGFLLRTHEDDSFDQPELRPLSPNIIVSRSDFFYAHDLGKTAVTSGKCTLDVIQSILRFRASFSFISVRFYFCRRLKIIKIRLKIARRDCVGASFLFALSVSLGGMHSRTLERL